MSINLLYHDVTSAGAEDRSGFCGPEAARYKLTADEFSRHLDRIHTATAAPPVADPAHLKRFTEGWTITFDDGGVSACTTIAELLERRGWRGWFFIATDFIDTPSFCTRDQLRDLHRRGHVIGSHSCSHPERISSCSSVRIQEEWSRSCEALASIIRAPILTASVPGGFYSREVAAAAAQAGVRWLFNSEPTTRDFVVDGCRILGRYNIYRGMSADDATSLLTSSSRRWRQAAFWACKKSAKSLAGPLYKTLRKRLLQRAYASS